MNTATNTVVHVSACYPPHLGGLEVVAQALAREQARRAGATVLTTDIGAGDAPRREVDRGVRVRRYRARSLAHTPIAPGLLWGLLRQPADRIRHVHVAQALTTELVWLTSRLRRARFVAHVHLDVDPSGPLGWLLAPYKRFLLGPALRAADAVIVLNQSMAGLLARRYRVEPGRVHVMKNGVASSFTDAGVGRPAEGSHAPRRYGDGAERPLRVLFAGRIAPQKNLPRLLRAVALTARSIDLTVVGDGEDRPACERLAADLGIQARFLGARYDEEYLAALVAADVFVLPSDQEGMPLAVLEAMAAGTPVLATRVPGTTELVGDAGLLVAPTPEDLAAGLTTIADRPALLDRLRDRGRELAAAHRWPAIADQIDAVYAEIRRRS
ncbi:MAG: glycosyltransferase family 4 protein [Nocardioides sp.]